jgi:uncharacterized membrane protein
MELLKQATLWLAAGVEAAAALVIGIAAIEAFVRALILFVPRRTRLDEPDAKEAVRLKLGRWLAVALELELGADILRTAVAPTWNEIGQLGAIVVLRDRTQLLPAEGDRRRPGAPHRSACRQPPALGHDHALPRHRLGGRQRRQRPQAAAIARLHRHRNHREPAAARPR